MIARVLLEQFLPNLDLSPEGPKPTNREEMREDWIAHVWLSMLGIANSFQEFTQINQLRFVTFNFDTLIEQKLSRNIENLFLVTKAESVSYVQSIITHVHGRLVYLPGQDPIEQILGQADGINIVHEAIPSATKANVVSQVLAAENIAFLGFGYHHYNVEKLGLAIIHAGISSLPGLIFGTAHGLGEGQRQQAKRNFSDRINVNLDPHNLTCLNLLREYDLLRSRTHEILEDRGNRLAYGLPR